MRDAGKMALGSIPSEGGATFRALNVAMGWIVAVWLLAAGLSVIGNGLFFTCMGGAMLTVILWASIVRFLSRPQSPSEEGQ